MTDLDSQTLLAVATVIGAVGTLVTAVAGLVWSVRRKAE
ncbi:MAG: hypothetical protein AVDCRST_MAG39-1627 [uncultured Sphingomonadaceae bacterium]|uniref:Uncharacterized protein n=1 Tax=uncultured Sphingomonadaceae bacterium TaxID=169976 RepID=A0A6J4STI2_9SPHN|nr:MAG: hypothetical protein AVDCRST_MAG39-1627 [uncultured Sphingomonadaceae bacterium]